MWVANEGTNNVTKLSPSGATLGTFAVGSGPVGIAFDGTNMWVANDERQQRHQAVPGGRDARHLHRGHHPVGGRVRRHEHVGHQPPSNDVTELSKAGATLGTFGVGTQPYGIAFDGASMWVTGSLSLNVTKL